MVLPVPEAVRVVEAGTDVEEWDPVWKGCLGSAATKGKVLLTHCMRLR
jgi:hypothetical protein